MSLYSLPRRRASRYRDLLGISQNPFPDTAIATQANMATFDPEVHPELTARMAQVFLGPDRMRAPRVTFLWSLGAGREARGYGKSAYLMWMAEAINADFGSSFLAMCGGKPSVDKVAAIYTSFSTISTLSLSGALYDATREFLRRNESTFIKLRDSWLESGRSEGDLYYAAREMASLANDHVHSMLLARLVFYDTFGWRTIFSSQTRWHEQRWGRRLFGSLTAVLRALGITRVLVLIDQLEDFIEGNRPWGSYYRDFSRLADVCCDDRLFANSLQIVLTMHPRATDITRLFWVQSKLGTLPDANDSERCVTIRGLKADGVVRLARRYLGAVRVAPLDGVEPFTMPALDRLCALTKGRPGAIIRALHVAIENAVDDGKGVIDILEIEEACS